MLKKPTETLLTAHRELVGRGRALFQRLHANGVPSLAVIRNNAPRLIGRTHCSAASTISSPISRRRDPPTDPPTRTGKRHGKIALIGASGAVGSRLLKELSDRGHTVTGIARNPEKIAVLPGVTAKKGDVFDRHGLTALIRAMMW